MERTGLVKEEGIGKGICWALVTLAILVLISFSYKPLLNLWLNTHDTDRIIAIRYLNHLRSQEKFGFEETAYMSIHERMEIGKFFLEDIGTSENELRELVQKRYADEITKKLKKFNEAELFHEITYDYYRIQELFERSRLPYSRFGITENELFQKMKKALMADSKEALEKLMKTDVWFWESEVDAVKQRIFNNMDAGAFNFEDIGTNKQKLEARIEAIRKQNETRWIKTTPYRTRKRHYFPRSPHRPVPFLGLGL